MLRPSSHLAFAITSLVGGAAAQSFQSTPAQIPAGSPSNNSFTENVDFADVDLDGDFDAALAEGGDCCNEQNRLWINQGGDQAGTIGFFNDETATRMPTFFDVGRDMEFVDLEGDGDFDLYTSNSSAVTNQGGRWLVNQGGDQAGGVGFYADETSTRFSGVGGPGSSVPPSAVLPEGNYIDWSCDSDFGDLDADGDLDLVASSYGGVFSGMVPTRLFLNDGSGVFSEFNPSGFQLTSVSLSDGDPALWAEGFQQANTSDVSGAFADISTSALDIDLGDIDGDLDLDLLHGARSEPVRMFVNRLEETGALAFRDATDAVFPPGHSTGLGQYEQEMGDLDGDDDWDIYGLNWQAAFSDATFANNGAGVFRDTTAVSNSGGDANEVDYLDYDADGDLDVFIANFSAQDKLYRNDTAGGSITLIDVTASELPSYPGVAWDADECDVDNDGDADLIVAHEGNSTPNVLLINVTNVADTHAPRIVLTEQAPGRTASPIPTVVRTQVVDNANYYVTWYADTQLEYRVDGGPFVSVPMATSMGQVFRGEIPGAHVGTIEYRVRSTDRAGNTSSTGLFSFVATDGGCNGSIATYCTAKPASGGCLPTIGSFGTPSESAGSGFLVRTSNVPTGNLGIFFYGKSGQASIPFQGGFLCVQPPTLRTPPTSSGSGAGCSGVYELDFNETIAAGMDAALVSGATVNLQTWFRDPVEPISGTGLSDGLQFTICP